VAGVAVTMFRLAISARFRAAISASEPARLQRAARDHLVSVIAALTAQYPDVAMKQLHNVR
jgi:hypothetical protein